MGGDVACDQGKGEMGGFKRCGGGFNETGELEKRVASEVGGWKFPDAYASCGTAGMSDRWA
jgi:hypothetical protein